MRNRRSNAPCLSASPTGMASSVMAEVARLLQQLATAEAEAAIDLRSLPLTAVDRAQLEEMLGKGEVRAALDLAGPTEVWETAYPGVWWVRHLGADRIVASEEISVTRVPEILKTHPADVASSARRMQQDLAGLALGALSVEEVSDV